MLYLKESKLIHERHDKRWGLFCHHPYPSVNRIVVLRLIILVPVSCPLWVRCVSLYSNTGVLVKWYFGILQKLILENSGNLCWGTFHTSEAFEFEDDDRHGNAG